MTSYLRQFAVFFDRYYWQTAVLIARNGLARQYRNSFLGMLWTLLQPLTMVIVYATIMPMIMRSSLSDYKLYMIVSLPVWGFFSSSLIGASSSIIANGETLKRCMISSTVFPVADVLRNTYTFFISFLVMYGVALILFAHFSLTLLLVPLFFIPVLIIIGAVAIGIAFLAPYIRDIGELTMVAMNMLFWFTPVVYSIDALPPAMQAVMHWNPFYIMLHPIQLLAYQHVVPSLWEIIHLLALTFVAILAGFSIFGVCRRNYVYYL